jgi:hypothetical protein
MERVDVGKGDEDDEEGVRGDGEEVNGVRVVKGEDGRREAMAGYAVEAGRNNGIVSVDMTLMSN